MMRRMCCAAWLQMTAVCFLCVFLTAAQVAAQDGDIAMLNRSAKAFSSVVKKAGPAVVYISVEKNSKDFSGANQMGEMFNDPFFEHFFGNGFRQKPRKQNAAGSGFIISSDGLILTNDHLVKNTDSIKVKLADKREFAASVVGTDPQSEVALIKINSSGLPTLPLGDSDALEVGEWVIAIGSPFELKQTVTVGVVSAKGRSGIGLSDYENFIQTDAAINPGNSGGPLLNIYGQVVGINTAIVSGSGGSIGIGFAIPINMAKSIEEQLRSKGKVVRGWLGLILQDMDEDLAHSFGLSRPEGILVSEVSPDSPAEKAGLRQGDVILSLNGSKLNDMGDLRNRVAMTPPGSTIRLEIIRDGSRQQVSVLIAEQPANFSETARTKMSKEHGSMLDKMGLTLQNLTADLAEQFGYSNKQGVIITQVEPGSPAAAVGMEPGQLIEEVNKMRVHSLAELKEALQQGKNPKQVLLIVRAGEYSRYVVLSNSGND